MAETTTNMSRTERHMQQLRSALRPFASASYGFGRTTPDNQVIVLGQNRLGKKIIVTVGDLRQADKILRKT
jgi:hypothetical protein